MKRFLIGLFCWLVAVGPSCGQSAQQDRSSDVPPPLALQTEPKVDAPQGEYRTLRLPDRPQMNVKVRCKSLSNCQENMLDPAVAMWQKIRQCWRPEMHFPPKSVISTGIRFADEGPFGAPPEPAKTVFFVTFRLNPNGTLAGRPTADGSGPAAAVKPYMIDYAISAVEQCQPYDMLPAAQYARWRQIFLRIGVEQNSGAPG